MTEISSVLEAAKEAHADRVEKLRVDAAARVEDVNSVVTGLLANVLGLDAAHPSLADMVWVASADHGQNDETVLAEPMVDVALDSELEGTAVRVVLNETIGASEPLKAEFVVNSIQAKLGGWESGAREWKPFDSLLSLGSALAG